jgi:hypothetical protein
MDSNWLSLKRRLVMIAINESREAGSHCYSICWWRGLGFTREAARDHEDPGRDSIADDGVQTVAPVRPCIG